MARGLSCQIYGEKGLNYPCSESKCVDQLQGYRAADLHLCLLSFYSHMFNINLHTVQITKCGSKYPAPLFLQIRKSRLFHDAAHSYSSDLLELTKEPTDTFREENSPTNKILVKNFPDAIDEDMLEAFFESRKTAGGGQVKNVQLNRENNWAVVEFCEADGMLLQQCNALVMCNHGSKTWQRAGYSRTNFECAMFLLLHCPPPHSTE